MLFSLLAMLFNFYVERDENFEANGLSIEYFHESFDIHFFIVSLVLLLLFHVMLNCDIHQLSPIVKNLC